MVVPCENCVYLATFAHWLTGAQACVGLGSWGTLWDDRTEMSAGEANLGAPYTEDVLEAHLKLKCAWAMVVPGLSTLKVLHRTA